MSEARGVQSAAERFADHPVMAERVLDPALAQPIRLVGHREQLFAAASERPLEYSVRIVDEQQDADRRPIKRLRAEIECGGFSSTMTNDAPSSSISTTILCSPASWLATSVAPKASL